MLQRLTTLKKITKSKHFNAYHQDNSLLIQFIFVEFFLLSKTLESIKSLFDTYSYSKKSLPKFLNSLANQLNELVDLNAFEKQEFYQGSVDKLKKYTFFFITNEKTKQDPSVYTHNYKMWLDVLHIYELIKTNQINPCNSIQKFLDLFDSILKSYSFMYEEIKKLLLDYADIENVILFVHRKKDAITKLYGMDFFDTLQTQKGVQSDAKLLLKQLIAKYRKRGFVQLSSVLKHE